MSSATTDPNPRRAIAEPEIEIGGGVTEGKTRAPADDRDASDASEDRDSVEVSEEAANAGKKPGLVWRTNLLLFVLTVASVFVTATLGDESATDATATTFTGLLGTMITNSTALVHGAQFTGALLLILVAHELGHYIAARIHKVDTSLPYFIPLPLLSPFGTMGAVIRMRGTIATRRALLDIGASGPLAGLCFAIPLYFWGASHSAIVSVTPNAIELGDSLLLKFLDHLASPDMPEGKTLMLSPVAFAAWAGMFVTMINLLPVGQLDGGHVAFALFGPKQDVFARNIHRAVFVFFVLMVAGRVGIDLAAGKGLDGLGVRVQGTLFWFAWFQMLAILGTISRKNRHEKILSVRMRIGFAAALIVLASVAKGPHAWMYWTAFAGVLFAFLTLERTRGVFRKHGLFDHPPTNDAPMGLPRQIVAVVTLLFFVALFMPTPFSM